MKQTLIIALVVVAAACGGGGGGGGSKPITPTEPGTPTTPTTPSQSASVSMRSSEQSDGYGNTTVSHSFSPAQVAVVVGGSVTWTNSSGIAHSVVFSTAAGAPSDIPAFDGGSNSRTFQTAGTYQYHCALHAGMSGTVVVQ